MREGGEGESGGGGGGGGGGGYTHRYNPSVAVLHYNNY